MSVNSQDPTNQAHLDATEAQKPNDKEYNFAQIRRQLEQEKSARMQAEERASQLSKQMEQKTFPSDDDDSEPYVDHKKLKRELSRAMQDIDQKIDQRAEFKARALVQEERQSNWMKNNPDFYEVMQHAQKFAEKNPELAEEILSMPEGFERQKVVYRNIKALGVHKKEEPAQSIQQKVDANRRSPYYQPSGVGAAPYASAGDFSPSGQKNAYEKLQQLKASLRI